MSASLACLILSLTDSPASRFAWIAQATLALAIVFAVLLAVVPVRKSSPPKTPGATSPWSFWDRLVYGGFVVSVGLLGVTALTVVFRSQTLHGWWLLAHMFAAALFLAFLLPLALTMSPRFALSHSTAHAGLSRLARLGYWLIIALSLAVIATSLLSMLPYFGTRDQVLFIELHRYCGLALLVAALIHPPLLRRR